MKHRRTLPAALIAITVAASGAVDAAQNERPSAVALPAEAAGWDGVVNGLVSVFDHADVLMLGEAHGRKVDGELRVRLVRHPNFARMVRFVVCERADTATERLLDRYVDGGELSEPERQTLARVGPTFPELFAAIRDVNRARPPADRVRVLAGRDMDDRASWDAWSVERIRTQVLAPKQKALVIYGSGHVWRSHGEMTKGLEHLIPGRVFVAETLTNIAPRTRGQAPPEYVALDQAMHALEATLQSRARPALVSLAQTRAAARLTADPFYLGQAMLGPDVTLADIDDAVVTFGTDTLAGR